MQARERGERKSLVQFGFLFYFFFPGYKCNAYAKLKDLKSFGYLQFVERRCSGMSMRIYIASVFLCKIKKEVVAKNHLIKCLSYLRAAQNRRTFLYAFYV